MDSWEIEPWQVPLLVMAFLAGPVWLYYKIQDVPWLQQFLRIPPPPAQPPDPEQQHPDDTTRRKPPSIRAWAETAALAGLTLLLVITFALALGNDAADAVASVASAVSAVVAASLTLHTIRQLLEAYPRGDSQKPAPSETADGPPLQ
jgi:hypothetical protein